MIIQNNYEDRIAFEALVDGMDVVNAYANRIGNMIFGYMLVQNNTGTSVAAGRDAIKISGVPTIKGGAVYAAAAYGTDESLLATTRVAELTDAEDGEGVNVCDGSAWNNGYYLAVTFQYEVK